MAQLAYSLPCEHITDICASCLSGSSNLLGCEAIAEFIENLIFSVCILFVLVNVDFAPRHVVSVVLFLVFTR